jgi:predicted MPP superfamily phosphohydrolase
MTLFVLTFLAVYAAMHALVFWGLLPLLAGHRALPALVGIWLVLMTLAPVLVRLLDRADRGDAARTLAWVGYSWMGLLFLAFCLFAVVAVCHLPALLVKRLLPSLPLLTLHRPAGSALVLLTVLAAGFYGYYEASDLRVEKVLLSTDRLPSAGRPLRLVQVSDLHLGLLHREEALAPIISRLQQLQPDLLVSTGDMVDAQIDHLDGLSQLWQQIQPPLGKFAVTGNHEYYAGLDQSLAFLERSGFDLLRGEAVTVGGRITLAGVDDPTGRAAQDEAALLAKEPRRRFTVLLKHRPRVNSAAAGLFDLQLSGHAHRGQVFPFNLLTGLEYPMQNGLYDLPGRGHLYTSRGTGTWGPPMRILSPPEITLFEIVGTGK